MPERPDGFQRVGGLLIDMRVAFERARHHRRIERLVRCEAVETGATHEADLIDEDIAGGADFAGELGVAMSWDALLSARSTIVMACAAARVPSGGAMMTEAMAPVVCTASAQDEKTGILSTPSGVARTEVPATMLVP